MPEAAAVTIPIFPCMRIVRYLLTVRLWNGRHVTALALAGPACRALESGILEMLPADRRQGARAKVEGIVVGGSQCPSLSSNSCPRPTFIFFEARSIWKINGAISGSNPTQENCE